MAIKAIASANVAFSYTDIFNPAAQSDTTAGMKLWPSDYRYFKGSLNRSTFSYSVPVSVGDVFYTNTTSDSSSFLFECITAGTTNTSSYRLTSSSMRLGERVTHGTAVFRARLPLSWAMAHSKMYMVHLPVMEVGSYEYRSQFDDTSYNGRPIYIVAAAEPDVTASISFSAPMYDWPSGSTSEVSTTYIPGLSIVSATESSTPTYSPTLLMSSAVYYSSILGSDIPGGYFHTSRRHRGITYEHPSYFIWLSGSTFVDCTFRGTSVRSYNGTAYYNAAGVHLAGGVFKNCTIDAIVSGGVTNGFFSSASTSTTIDVEGFRIVNTSGSGMPLYCYR
jgi:hypothetical protein